MHELLVGTREVQQLIYDKRELSDIRGQAIKDGMTTLKQDGIMKILEGFSDYAQLLRIISEWQIVVKKPVVFPCFFGNVS